MNSVTEKTLANLYKSKFFAFKRSDFSQPCVEEVGGPFKALITRQYEADKGRGLHESAADSEFTTPVFYCGCGWVDMDYDLVVEILDNFNIEIPLKKEKNTWVKKDEASNSNEA